MKGCATADTVSRLKTARYASARWPILCVVAGSALSVASGSGQTTQTNQPAPQPTFRTEANYVRVDVFPTRDGAPIADLTAEDFEVLENNAPQRIEQFERVVVRAAGPQETRIEPTTVAASRSMAENPRARLFVLFLDTYHVDVAASHNIRKPLIDALDRVIGQDDMVAVMTPEMSARDVTFARKTTTIEGILTRYWHWGERDRMNPSDPEDEAYGACYPQRPKTPSRDCSDQNGIAAEMIDRRHEKRVLDALQDLVRYLRGVREERKAILAITNGWLLYRPNGALARPLNCHGIPSGPAVGIDPRTGKLTTKDLPTVQAPNTKCETDRSNLAQIDDDQEFRELLDEANAANASFYPVDPRGLAVFDTPIVRTDVPGPPAPMTPLAVDRAMLTGRLNSLRTLAEATDGLAIVDSNDLAGGLRRVVDDLSSYYLLGYYSSGKLDGRFHTIKVRVKRPGVQVRARRGYLAATPAAVTAAATAAAARSASPAAANAEALAVEAALGSLADSAREMPMRLQASAGWRPGSDGRATAAFWVIGEFAAGTPPGREIEATVVAAAGSTVARGTSQYARNVLIALTPSEPVEPGEYTIRVRADAFGSVRVTLPHAPDAGGAVLIRRGPTTGNREVPTADRRFRRSEQLRAELPSVSGPMTARLLDRTGKPLAVPVAANVRDEADGSRWQTAQLALAPLAAGDYIIELTGGAEGAGGAGGAERAVTVKRTLVAFRVVQ
jgi:VWFA-related protein